MLGPCAQLKTWDPCRSSMRAQRVPACAEDLCRKKVFGWCGVPRQCQLLLKGRGFGRGPQGGRGRRRMVRQLCTKCSTNSLIVQSSQFGSGFDCAMEHHGGGRCTESRGNRLTEDLGSVIHGSLGRRRPGAIRHVVPRFARLQRQDGSRVMEDAFLDELRET
eukprot:4379930-Amphidinium_carterae.2